MGSLTFVWQLVYKENPEVKQIIDLEREGLHQAILDQNTLPEWNTHDQFEILDISHLLSL